jgi:Golgi phosphoprotein 3 (GPP34)
MAHRGVGLDSFRELSLVDWTFLACHDDRTGKPRIDLDVLGAGLVAAGLVQLLEAGAIDVKDTGQIFRTTDRHQPDETSNYLLDQIYTAEPKLYPAFDWITVLRAELYAGVGLSLATAGVVQIEKSAMGRQVRYIAPQRLATQPMTWVYGLLRTPHAALGSVPAHQRHVTAIVASLGVAPAVTPLPASEVEAHLPVVLQQCSPAVNAIMAATRQVKQKIAMTIRR